MAHLLLKLVSQDVIQQETVHRFSSQGGTVGRSTDCQWTITDPECFISKVHLSIAYKNDQFILTDISTNGVHINQIGNLLGHGNQHVIKLTDKLILGQFEIIVDEISMQLSTSSAVIPDMVDDLGLGLSEDLVDPLDLLSSSPPESMSSSSLDNLHISNDEEDDLDLILSAPMASINANETDIIGNDSDNNNQVTSDIIQDDWNDTDIKSIIEPQCTDQSTAPELTKELVVKDIISQRISDESQPQTPVAKPLEEIKPQVDIKPLEDIKSVAPIPPSKANFNLPHAIGSNDQDEFLSLLYENLGLPKEFFNNLDKKEFAHDLSAILFSTTNGLMSLLNSRSILKQEAHLALTAIAPTENNPLKFSVTATDTLELLLIRKKSGYLSAQAAYDEAIYDLQLHQMAFLSGLQATLTGVLNQVEPSAIEALAKESQRNILGLNTTSLSWEMYKEKQQELNNSITNNINEVLGDFFADAYQARINQLKNNSE